MRNVNELVGIVKGINFDNIINNREVLRLQTWVDENRNLVYAPEQVELIKLLDTVLEDRVLTESELNRVLEFCEKQIQNDTMDMGRLYELNGIVQGIVCDGVVNEGELLKLRDWMKCNDSFFGTPSASLCLCVA